MSRKNSKSLSTEELLKYTEEIKDLVNKCLVKAGNISQLHQKAGIRRHTIYRLLEGRKHTKTTIIKLRQYLNG